MYLLLPDIFFGRLPDVRHYSMRYREDHISHGKLQVLTIYFVVLETSGNNFLNVSTTNKYFIYEQTI